jgi:hypothetical protein
MTILTEFCASSLFVVFYPHWVNPQASIVYKVLNFSQFKGKEIVKYFKELDEGMHNEAVLKNQKKADRSIYLRTKRVDRIFVWKILFASCKSSKPPRRGRLSQANSRAQQSTIRAIEEKVRAQLDSKQNRIVLIMLTIG